jgi:hypothetical protein
MKRRATKKLLSQFSELLDIETKSKTDASSSSRQPFVAARNAEFELVKWNGPCWHFDRSEKCFSVRSS